MLANVVDADLQQLGPELSRLVRFDQLHDIGDI